MERLVGFFTFEASEASFAADAPKRGTASLVTMPFEDSAEPGRVSTKEKSGRF
jgi:hypothetical protein